MQPYKKKVPRIFVAFVAMAFLLPALLFLPQEFICWSGDCLGIEQRPENARYFVYFAISGGLGFGLSMLALLMNDFFGKSRLKQSMFLGALLLGFIFVMPFAFVYERQLTSNYQYCYDTTGEFDKKSNRFWKYEYGVGCGAYCFLQQASLYIKNGNSCPDQNLFLYWYDEAGDTFSSFTTHPEDAEIEAAKVVPNSR